MKSPPLQPFVAEVKFYLHAKLPYISEKHVTLHFQIKNNQFLVHYKQ